MPQSRHLEPGVVDPVFDVEVEEGEVTFEVVIRNAGGLALYQGATTTTIDADGFAVTIVPVPVNPVLVVSPRVISFTTTDNGEVRTHRFSLRVRNPGTDGLLWRVDSAGTLPTFPPFPQTPNTFTCRLPTFDGVSCFVNRTWAHNQDEPVEITVTGEPNVFNNPISRIRFISDNSGTLTVPP